MALQDLNELRQRLPGGVNLPHCPPHLSHGPEPPTLVQRDPAPLARIFQPRVATYK